MLNCEGAESCGFALTMQTLCLTGYVLDAATDA
jgi:hypothetical protein